MGIKGTLKRSVERWTRTHIIRELPRGTDLFHDIRVELPDYHLEVVFDVGANVGHSALSFLEQYPDCRIYCFEPGATNFDTLQRTLGSDKRITCINAAFSACEGNGTMVLGSRGDCARIVLSNEREFDNEPNSAVPVCTVDSFCGASNIERIDFLKIDTEGHDLEVLKGAHRMLTDGAIGLVEVEAGMNPENELHVPLHRLQELLESHDYYLFGFYEQYREWPSNQPHLRRTNPVFLSRELRERHRGPKFTARTEGAS